MSYYIYQLVDPRTGKPFYIGKGKKKRIDAHEKEAKKGVYSNKCRTIREIWDKGLQIEKQILCKFSNEMDAYEAEKELIEKIGLENLTNVVAGGIQKAPRKVKEKVQVSNWTLKALKGYAPTLAKTIRMLEGNKRIYIANIDMTPSWHSFFNKLVKEIGAEAVIEMVKPHGVDLRISYV